VTSGAAVGPALEDRLTGDGRDALALILAHRRWWPSTKKARWSGWRSSSWPPISAFRLIKNAGSSAGAMTAAPSCFRWAPPVTSLTRWPITLPGRWARRMCWRWRP